MSNRASVPATNFSAPGSVFYQWQQSNGIDTVTLDANSAANLSAGAILAGNEHVKVGKLRKRLCRLAEVSGQHIGRVARNPLRQVYRLIGPSVEPNQDAALFVAHIFNRVSVPLRNVRNISLLQGLDAEPPVRPEQGDVHLTVDDVLPLVGIGMPMQLA